jgi:hypothetical protein
MMRDHCRRRHERPPHRRLGRLGSQRAAADIHQFQDHRGQNELHRQFHLAARGDDDVGPRHEGVVHHRQQVGKIDPLGIGEADDDEAFVRRRYVARRERIGSVDGGHALKVDMCLRELRTDVIHVIRHAPQNGVDHGFRRIPAGFLVAMQLLNPFQIDDGDDTDGQIRVLRDIDLRRDHRAVQSFVEQEIRVPGDRLPLGKGSRLLLERLRFLFVVQIAADLAAPGFTVSLEQRLQFLEEIVLRAEVTEMRVAPGGGIRHFHFHRFTVVAMEGIALDHGGFDAFAAKNPAERARDRRRAGSGRTGDRDDGVFG